MSGALVRSLLAGHPARGPRTVHFDLVNRCNTRCVTCWHHSPLLPPEARPTPAWLALELPVPVLTACLDSLGGLGGLEEVILSGMGEPLLASGVYEILAATLGRGLHVTVITNLLAADPARLHELVDRGAAGRLELLVSVCGADEVSWDAFHGGSPRQGFPRLLRQLEHLRQLGLPFKQVQVIERENFRLLPGMVRLGAATGARQVSFKLAALGPGTSTLALTPAEQQELVRDVLPVACAEAVRLGLPTDLEAFATQLRPDPLQTAPIEQVGCFMGQLYARVTVELELLYCCSTEVPVGRLGPGGDFASHWRGPRWQAVRDRLRKGQYFPGCARCGKYKQNLKWSRRLQALLPPARFAELIGQVPSENQRSSAKEGPGRGSPDPAEPDLIEPRVEQLP